MTNRADTLRVQVVARVQETSDTVSLRFAAAAADSLPAWDPGAHIDVYLPIGIRQYSLSGSPGSLQEWRITVPMIEIAASRGLPWRLHYAARSAMSFAFTDTLNGYGENISLWSRDGAGRLDVAAIMDGLSTRAHIYCCGPAGLMDQVTTECAASNLSGKVHLERFTPVETSADEAVATEFALYCAVSNLELTVKADQSILDALNENGVLIPSSCAAGTCGSCETRVLEGEVVHRDSILSPAERALNDRIFVCVSRCTSKRLVLDV
jgi:ferredoxin-NADP reductase